jgi:hypothetical protein
MRSTLFEPALTESQRVLLYQVLEQLVQPSANDEQFDYELARKLRDEFHLPEVLIFNGDHRDSFWWPSGRAYSETSTEGGNDA